MANLIPRMRFIGVYDSVGELGGKRVRGITPPHRTVNGYRKVSWGYCFLAKQ